MANLPFTSVIELTARTLAIIQAWVSWIGAQVKFLFAVYSSGAWLADVTCWSSPVSSAFALKATIQVSTIS